MTRKTNEPLRNSKLINSQLWALRKLRKKRVETYAEHLGFSEAAKAEIGYVGYSNQKFKVVSDNDLEIALGSGGFHKDNIQVLYICRKEEQAGKRTVHNVEGE